MNKLIIFTGIIVIITASLFFILTNNNGEEKVKITPPNVGDGGLLPQNREVEGYEGKVLAGNTALFLEYTKADYEKAKDQGKIIVLDFYADWCPICRAEEPEIFAGFNELTTDQVIGFRVNFKDSATDADEQALAREFAIPYQHTKIIVKNGAEVSRHTKQWTRTDMLNAVNSAL